MRCLGLVLAGVAACGSGDDPVPNPYGAHTLPFGPVTIEAHSEDLSRCVVLSLGNEEPLYINEVQLTTGPGFHHSNWLWVPQHYPQDTPDGIFDCEERGYDQTGAGVLGGVFFAQSTQAEHEVQSFPSGVVIALPRRARVIAQLHLLNSGDEAVTVQPSIGYTAIPPAEVTTMLSSVTFEFHPLALPPQRRSRFTIECDLSAAPNTDKFNDAPGFKLYYALAHYHEWGTGLKIEAVSPAGTAATVYSTEGNVGDVLGGRIDPEFSMSGYTKLRLSCDYFNDTNQTLYYGNGNGEMCIFNAFSDSPWMWAGGALNPGSPGPATEVDGVLTYTRDCQVYVKEPFVP